MATEYDHKAAGKVHHAAVSRDYISQPRLSKYDIQGQYSLLKIFDFYSHFPRQEESKINKVIMFLQNM